MTPSNENIFRVTVPLWGEFTGHRWIPLTKASDVELRCFLWSAPEQTFQSNNRDAGDFRRHRTQYDVTAVYTKVCFHRLTDDEVLFRVWKSGLQYPIGLLTGHNSSVILAIKNEV